VRVINWEDRQCTIDETPHRREYQGLTYYFCSPQCLEKFDEDPERHTKGSWHGGAELER
jgi:YHS domain-containing protein